MAEEIEVPLMTAVPPYQGKAAIAPPKLCTSCGKELLDKRYNTCESCRPAAGSGRVTNNRVRTPGPKPSDKTHRGMNSITGKMLGMITLAFAWSQLRRLGVPDTSGDIADTMAMTEDEALAIGKPLSRIFLASEPGKRLGPKMVENEDAIDAIFAVWDWYKRQTTILDQYRANSPAVPSTGEDIPAAPRRSRQSRSNTDERVSSNGSIGSVEQHQGESESAIWNGQPVGYVPPTDLDWAGAL
jgi:hypothetical protein